LEVGIVIVEIFLIIAGLVMLAGLMGAVPALGEHLEKLAKWLGSFEGIIGIIAIIIGIIYFSIPMGLLLIVAGIILAIGLLQALPMVGDTLKKLVKALSGFHTIFGIIFLLLGILGLIGII
jgi:hypothetical protein